MESPGGAFTEQLHAVLEGTRKSIARVHEADKEGLVKVADRHRPPSIIPGSRSGLLSPRFVQDNHKLRGMVADTAAIASELRLEIAALKTQAAAAADEQLRGLEQRLAATTEQLTETEQDLEATSRELAETKDQLTTITAKYDELKTWRSRQRELQQRETQLLQREQAIVDREQQALQREQELPCPQSVMPSRTQARTSPP